MIKNVKLYGGGAYEIVMTRTEKNSNNNNNKDDEYEIKRGRR